MTAADERAGWVAGTKPWARRTAPEGFGPKVGKIAGARCYFCGEDTIKLSIGDVPDDAGRLQLYCDYPRCAAREVTVLVERDGAGASRRADVRALAALDDPDLVGDTKMLPGGLMVHGTGRPNDADVTARRVDDGPRDLLVP